MKDKLKLKWLVWGLVVAPLLLAVVVRASPGAVPWSAMPGGGGASSSDSYRQFGSVGQGQPVGAASSQGYRLGAGFSYGLGAIPVPAGANYRLASIVMASAGSSSSSGSYRLAGTLGQGMVVGTSSGQSSSAGAGFWYGAAVAPAPPRSPDVNGDGVVDDSDLAIIIASYGTSPPSDPRADVNGDNVVDVLDLAEVGSHFGGPP